MSHVFETNDGESNPLLKPLRVPSLADGLIQTAKELVDDLPEWTLLEADDAKGVLSCERSARLLSGKSKVTIRIESPEGVPSTTVNLRSESSGGLRKGDRANVIEFMRLFMRRVV